MEAASQLVSFEYDVNEGSGTSQKSEGIVFSKEALLRMTMDSYDLQLRTFVYNRLRSRIDVDDLMQDLYCRLITYQGVLRFKSLRPFVFTIAINLIRDKLRRNTARMTANTVSIDEIEEISVETTDPVRVVSNVKDLVWASKVIEQLSPCCKKAFYLHRINGFSQKETALLMGITVSMVEKHVMKATKSLRQKAGLDKNNK